MRLDDNTSRITPVTSLSLCPLSRKMLGTISIECRRSVDCKPISFKANKGGDISANVEVDVVPDDFDSFDHSTSSSSSWEMRRILLHMANTATKTIRSFKFYVTTRDIRLDPATQQTLLNVDMVYIFYVYMEDVVVTALSICNKPT